MGCCISTPKDDQNTLKNQQNFTQEAKCKVPPPQSKSPPHIVEEESVKEVLFETETPISKPQQVPNLTQETMTQMQNMEITKDPIMKKPLEEEPSEEISVISETCSVGESYSYSYSTTTTTATVPETREDEVTSKRRIREGTQNRNRNRNRSHSDASRNRSYNADRNRVGGRERRRPKSPARVPEIPPEKKIVAGSRSVCRREFSDKLRRDSGTGVCRRSRSPSCHRTAGSSNGRSELRQTEKDGRRFPPTEVVGDTNDGVSVEESFTNPHVSLECFIFL
ncbi:hypothetical protein MtrunA17_Chr2g0323991 [Medicago truncatula]|uniref:Uncharacterized protein n=1 Tax=Medicago truncatula TaxID=3880 RepID=A0A072VAM7_MEDTR|nr:hypothetical protein MTR_2g090150 [Medicago truncatula]RHN75691.1 hypothetical protein MtrunA17_Chr2g0323991 [Medicago truncatula]